MDTITVQHDTNPVALVDCPGCGTPFAWPPTGRCTRCGADLAGRTATAIFDVDREAAALREERAALVTELRAASQPPAGRLPATAMPPPVVRAGRGPTRSRLRPQLLLAAAGAVLLLAAAVVFIAVTWPTWPAGAQVAFVVALTAVGAVAARGTARRALAATADALGVLTLAVAAYSLLAARAEGLAGLAAVDVQLWVALVATAVAVAARPFTHWAGLRDTPRRAAALAAVVAGGSGLLWLAQLHLTTPRGLAPLAAAPAVAGLLLLHGRWVLRRDDVVRHLVPAVPAALLGGAAVATGLVALTLQSSVAVAVAAAVGIPLLLVTRRRAPTAAWTFAGATIAALWLVQLVTFLTTEATAGALGLEAPRLVTFSVVAALGVTAAQWWRPPAPWRDPVLLAAGLAAVPAVGVTLDAWSAPAAVVSTVLAEPFHGWPDADPLSASVVLLAVAALTLGAALVNRLRRDLVLPFVAAGATTIAAVVAVAGAAGGLLPAAAPLLVAGLAACTAAWWWEAHPSAWVPVVVTHTTALVLAGVDLELFAATAAAVAVHLVWVAARRHHPVAAAGGVASGLLAVAATSEALAWSTGTTTLLVTLAGGAVMVWAQLAGAGRTWRHGATDTVVAITAVAATLVAQAAAPAATVAAQLATIAVVAVVHAARPGRGWTVWVASTATSLAVWSLLADQGVEVVEAFTLPAALALAAAGTWRLHVSDTSSWTALSPACLMAALPTLAILLDGPDPARVLLLATGAVAASLVGHARRLAAPLALGTVTAMLAAVLQLYDWSLHLPRWVTFGVLGLALIGTSATYEAQLRRARAAREHLQALR